MRWKVKNWQPYGWYVSPVKYIGGKDYYLWKTDLKLHGGIGYGTLKDGSSPGYFSTEAEAIHWKELYENIERSKRIKPFNADIIERMAEHSNECAAYASAMKWDWLRRQKIEDVCGADVTDDCGFCKRWGQAIVCEYECLLLKIQGESCLANGTSWRKAREALALKDQQAFTTAANTLYYQIHSIIDDFYKTKPEPKEEVFYHVGQRFRLGSCSYYRLCMVGGYQVSMVHENYKGCWSSPVKVCTVSKITEAEFNEICSSSPGSFTLIKEEEKTK